MPPKPDTAVILAAGEGSRLAHQGYAKPLLPLLGVPLLERSIRCLMAAGIRRIVVVCGHRGEEVAAFAKALGHRIDADLHVIRHQRWRGGNGSSALAAKPAVNGTFLMVMCDHLFGPEMLSRLMRSRVPKGGLVLAVDGDLRNRLVDMEDVTRVRRCNGDIKAIGKGLDDFDAFDTGAFLCTQGVFAALSAAVEANEGSLSAAVTRLAEKNKAATLDVSGAFWMDVDDEAAIGRRSMP